MLESSFNDKTYSNKEWVENVGYIQDITSFSMEITVLIDVDYK